jgi:hypothetical protein
MSPESPARVSESIQALKPPEDAPEADYMQAFRAIAELLLNRTALFIAGRPHRLTEIEFYFNGLGHRDPFTHGDPHQKSLGRWYFHRQGGEYRGGTYKGVDIAFGSEEAFGGVLVRGARALDGAREILDGPCMFVDHVLGLTGASSVAALVNTFDTSIDPPEGAAASPLYLAEGGRAGEGDRLRVFESARVGLTLKRGTSEERRRFLANPYRFLTGPRDIKKGRPHIVLGLYRQGVEADEIASLTGVSRANVGRYVSAYEAGKGRKAEGPAGDLSTDDLCALLGACEKDCPIS